ncbi:unnamed protein product [Cochlearia groenlandica]
MGVAVLNPQDYLKQPFSHMKYPQRQKKPISNRTRRRPPRNQTTRSPSPPPASPPLLPPLSAVKKTPKTVVVSSHVKILKRGEEIAKKTTDLAVEKSDLGPTRRTGSDPVTIPIRKSKTVPFYAGPVTLTSPPPSDVPLPAFFTTKKSVSLFQAADATNDLIRILRLNIA